MTKATPNKEHAVIAPFMQATVLMCNRGGIGYVSELARILQQACEPNYEAVFVMTAPVSSPTFKYAIWYTPMIKVSEEHAALAFKQTCEHMLQGAITFTINHVETQAGNLCSSNDLRAICNEYAILHVECQNTPLILKLLSTECTTGQNSIA